jgi:hypothetical protein
MEYAAALLNAKTSDPVDFANFHWQSPSVRAMKKIPYFTNDNLKIHQSHDHPLFGSRPIGPPRLQTSSARRVETTG